MCKSKMYADTCTDKCFEAMWSLKSYLAGLQLSKHFWPCIYLLFLNVSNLDENRP